MNYNETAINGYGNVRSITRAIFYIFSFGDRFRPPPPPHRFRLIKSVRVNRIFHAARDC